MQKHLAPALKTLLHLSLTLSIILPSYSYALPDPAPAPENSKAYLNSKNSFQELIQDPFISETYFDAIRSTLRYPPDRIQADYYDNNPFWQSSEMRKAERAVMEDGISSAVRDGQVSMSRITPKTDKWLYDILQNIARNFGYSAKAIARMEAFIMPDLNASMGSPYTDHAVIYIGKPLVDAMRVQMTNTKFNKKRGEQAIMGVIGHEFTHNILGHVLQGFRNSAMVLQLGGIFAKGAGFANLDFRDIENFDPDNRRGMTQEAHDFWNQILNNLLPRGNPDFPNSSSTPTSSDSKLKKRMFLKYLKAQHQEFQAASYTKDPVRNALNVLNGSTVGNADAGKESIIEFLEMTINSLSLMPVPDKNIGYLEHLLSNFKQAIAENRNPYQVGTVEFLQVMSEVLGNLGKAMETSADNGGLAQTNFKNMSEGFLRFMNVDMDPVLANYVDKDGKPTLTFRQLRDLVLEEKREEWKLFLAQNSDEDILEQLGGADSAEHPGPLKRLMHFFLGSQATETIGFRNSFLRHVILYNRLLIQANTANAKISKITNNFEGFLAQMKASGNELPPGVGAKIKAEVDRKVKVIETLRDNSVVYSKKVSDKILVLINDPALPKLDGKNPRLLDFIDFQLARRQDQLEAANTFLKQIPKKDQDRVRQNIKAALGAATDNSLLETINSQLVAEKAKKGADLGQINNRLNELAVLLNPDSDLPRIIVARTELQTDGKKLARGTSIAIVKPDPAKLFSAAGEPCRTMVLRATN